MPRSGSEHLTFLDGLRAVAVGSVILYHVGRLPGGFVGVDVFFVISGFLIIGQVTSALTAGDFSFSDFWARRAFRILPAYLLVIIVCAAASAFFLVLPGDYREFSHELVSSALMNANHYFLAQQGYFDKSAQSKVLLHLWSLSVEEQFYLFVPLLCVVIWRIRNKLRLLIASLLFLLSLVGCAVWTGHLGDKNYGFYLMPLRAWEFMAGGAIGWALPFVRKLSRGALEGFGVIGAALILVGDVVLTNREPYPSLLALLPVTGAAILIAANAAHPRLLTGRALSLSPLVGIGIISYALYLWHWPVLVFLRMYNFDGRIPRVGIIAVAVALALSIATRFLIEKPVLHWRRTRGLSRFGWRPAIVGALACVVCSGLGYVGLEAASTAVAANGVKNEFTACYVIYSHPMTRCIDTPQYGLLVGDSHAIAAASDLTDAARAVNTSILTVAVGGCASIFLADVAIPGSDMARRCRQQRQRMLDLFGTGQFQPSFAVLYSRWSLYTKTGQFSLKSDDPSADPHQVFVAKLRQTMTFLRSHGVSRILVIGPTPTFTRQAPRCVETAIKYDASKAYCSVSASQNAQIQRDAMDWLKQGMQGLTDVRFIDPTPVFCDKTLCRPYDGREVLFVDNNHIDDRGFAKVMSAYASDFNWVLTGHAGTENRSRSVRTRQWAG